MTASSFLGNDHRPFNARLRSPIDRGWCASRAGTRGSYLQIDLERDYAFCGIRVQGAKHGHVNTFELRFARGRGDPFIPYGVVRGGIVPTSHLLLITTETTHKKLCCYVCSLSMLATKDNITT